MSFISKFIQTTFGKDEKISTPSLEIKKKLVEKKYSCPHCQHAFDRKLKLNYHMNHQVCIWSEPSNLFCVFCNKKFRTKYALKKHLYKHNIHYLKDYKQYLNQPEMVGTSSLTQTINEEVVTVSLEDRWKRIVEIKQEQVSSNLDKNWVKYRMEEMITNKISNVELSNGLFVMFTKMQKKDWPIFSQWYQQNSYRMDTDIQDEIIQSFQQWVETMIWIKKHSVHGSKEEWDKLFDIEDIHVLSNWISVDWFPKIYYDQNMVQKPIHMFQVVDKYGTMEVEYQRISKKQMGKLYQFHEKVLEMKENVPIEFSKYKSYLHQYQEEWNRNRKYYPFSSTSQQSGLHDPMIVKTQLYQMQTMQTDPQKQQLFGHLVSKWFMFLQLVENGHQWKQLFYELFYHKRYAYTNDFMEYFAGYMEYYIENMRLFRKQGWYLKGIEAERMEEKITGYYLERTRFLKKCSKQKMYTLLEQVFQVNPLSIGNTITIDTEPKPNVIFSQEVPKMFEVQFN